MSTERPAWSGARGARLTAAGPFREPRSTRHYVNRAGAAFTLIEMLIVIAIIAVLSALLVPAMQGLMGTSGRRGGVNTMMAVFEQARLSAMESGVRAYVGFPVEAANKTNAFSHVIVYRDPRPDETAPVAVTRWQKLPQGVFYEGGANFGATKNSSNVLPKLGGETIGQVAVLEFNRFGQLVPNTNEVKVMVGEKALPTPTDPWLRNESNFFEISVQPLTGRAVVADKSGTFGTNH